MASTYSTLKIQLMGTGENAGTWGTVTNTNLGTAIEEAITGSADVTFSNANVTLLLVDSNTSQTARNLRLNLIGTTGAARDLIVPAIEKLYLVNNGCAHTITVKNSTGTGTAVPAGATMYVYNNGTNVVDAITHLTSLTLGTPLAIAQGGTGSNTGVNLQSSVIGVLPIANGGTGSTTATFSGANITSINANSISTGTLAVARGGTGAATLTGLVLGNGTSAFTTVTAPSGAVVGTTDTQTLSAKTFDNYTEKVFTITDGAGFEINPNNGPIQLITLGANRTPKATTFAAGQSVILMVDDGSSYTITWTDTTFGPSGVIWKTDSGIAPTLNATGYTAIVLWKVGTQVYGARVGDA